MARKQPRSRNSTAPKANSASAVVQPPLSGNSISRPPLFAFEAVRGTGELELARLAERQHGCVHRRQLLAAGFTQQSIKTRVAQRRLTRIHPKVFLVGATRPGNYTAEMAAVLHFRGHAVLGGLSAGALWQLLDEPPANVHVTATTTTATPPAGVVVRTSVSLGRGEVSIRRGMPVTAPGRTLVELAGLLGKQELENALAQARRRVGLSDQQLLRAIELAPPNTAGIAVLRRLMSAGRAADTRSVYERKLLEIIRQAGLPEPITNCRVAGHLVDMYWPEQRLVVEFDGWAWHADRASFETDRRRDQDLIAAGCRAARVTARQLDDEPYRLIVTLATIITSPRPPLVLAE